MADMPLPLFEIMGQQIKAAASLMIFASNAVVASIVAASMSETDLNFMINIEDNEYLLYLFC